MYQPCGSGTQTPIVIAPVLLTAAASEGVARVVNVELSGEIATVQDAIVFVAAPTISTATVIGRVTGFTFAVPDTHAPVFGNVPDVIGGAFRAGWFDVLVKSSCPAMRTVPSAFSMLAG